MMNDLNNQSGWFGSSKQGPVTNPGKSREIHLELIRLLYRQAPQALGTSIIVASILAGILWQVADHGQLLLWFGAVMSITILRILLVIAFRRADITLINFERWDTLYLAGAFFAGLCWGSVAILWSPAWPVAYQVLLLLTLAGLSAAAISSNAPRLSTFAVFMFPLLLPFAGILLVQKEQAYVSLGLLLLLYPSMLYLITRNYHNTIRESLGYRFANQSLLNELSKHVEQLQDEVSTREKAQSDLVTLNEKLRQRVMAHERAENLLSESERQHRHIFESATDAMLVFNNDGDIVKANPAAYKAYSYENDEMIGLSGRNIIHPDYHRLFELLHKQFENEGKFHAESLDVRKDGTTFDTDVSGSTIIFNGETHLLEVVHDITERKWIEAELVRYRDQLEALVRERTVELAKTNEQLQRQISERNQAEEQNHLLLESTSDGIYTVDHKGICTVCNPAAAHILGFNKPAELIGKNAHNLFHHSRLDGSAYPEQECTLLHAYEKNITVAEEVFWRTDGTSFPVEYHASPIYRDKEVVGSVVSFTDMSQRQKTESQLRQAQKLEAVGQLAAGIAHEINTPTQFLSDNTLFLQDAFADYNRLFTAYERLVGICAGGSVPQSQLNKLTTLAEELDIDYLKQEIPLSIEQSLEGMGRISKIVQAMKEFSHPGMEEKTPTDLNRAIQTTIDVSRNEWKYSAELITELDPALPQVPVLPGEFNQVILNMIVNAAHAITDAVGSSGKMGEIRITSRQDEEWVEITISDTGKGIPEEIQKRIFDPFFTTKEVGKGSGQGLAISWSVIVDKHGGTIKVESIEGLGTTFIIRLPLQDSSDSNL